jgi:hypothetical protein
MNKIADIKGCKTVACKARTMGESLFKEYYAGAPGV